MPTRGKRARAPGLSPSHVSWPLFATAGISRVEHACPPILMACALTSSLAACTCMYMLFSACSQLVYMNPIFPLCYAVPSERDPGLLGLQAHPDRGPGGGVTRCRRCGTVSWEEGKGLHGCDYHAGLLGWSTEAKDFRKQGEALQKEGVVL
eukprot:1157539-Pelagomonas_calceolata.AAC.3